MHPHRPTRPERHRPGHAMRAPARVKSNLLDPIMLRLILLTLCEPSGCIPHCHVQNCISRAFAEKECQAIDTCESNAALCSPRRSMTRRIQGACRRCRGQGTARCLARQGRGCSAATATDGPAAGAVAGRRRDRRGNRPRIRLRQGRPRAGAAAPCQVRVRPVRPPSRRWGCRGRDRAIRRSLCRPSPCCLSGEATPAERRLPAPGA